MRLKERFHRVMNGEAGMRPPRAAFFGPWKQTLDRWHREGLVGDDWARAAGFEDGSQHPVPVNAFICPLLPETVLAEEGASRVIRDQHGVVKRVRADDESMPQFLHHPVQGRADWERLRPLLSDPDHPERFPSREHPFLGVEDWGRWRQEWEERDSILFLGMLPCGFFGGLRELMGLETALTAFYDDPGLVENMLDTLCDLWSAFYPRVLRQVRVDFVFIWEDMCYRGGPLISPATFRRFLLPRYRRMTEALRRAGVRNIFVDSDGDVTQLIPQWIEGGVTGVLPFEVASGLDLASIARQYPELQMIGGIDKRALAAGPEAIEAELAKLPSLLERGRYIPAVDHGVPPDVSWANYRRFAERLGAILDAFGQ